MSGCPCARTPVPHAWHPAPSRRCPAAGVQPQRPPLCRDRWAGRGGEVSAQPLQPDRTRQHQALYACLIRNGATTPPRHHATTPPRHHAHTALPCPPAAPLTRVGEGGSVWDGVWVCGQVAAQPPRHCRVSGSLMPGLNSPRGPGLHCLPRNVCRLQLLPRYGARASGLRRSKLQWGPCSLGAV